MVILWEGDKKTWGKELFEPLLDLPL